MTDTVTTTDVTCSQCSRCVATKTKRLPRGWRRHAEAVWCDRCWSVNWVVRAVTIPVAGPDDGKWADLRVALQAAFRDATRLANWAVRQLAQAEPPREATQERMPAAPRLYLYPGARALVPNMDTGSVVAILHAVEGRYKARRLASYWRCEEALPSYRYPMPISIAGQRWEATQTPDGRPAVSVRLGGRRWLLRLRGGHQFWRQLADHERIANGTAIRGELALIQKAAHAGDHRSEGKAGTRLMAKLVGWFQRTPAKEASGTMKVTTAPDVLWTWQVEKDAEVHRYPADRVRSLVVQHAIRRQRWSEELQHEHRWPKEVRKRMVGDHHAALAKHHGRMHAWVREACAMIGTAAKRRKVSKVVYDDTERGYAALPWDQLRTRLAHVLAGHGIELEISSGEVVSPEPVALESTSEEAGQ